MKIFSSELCLSHEVPAGFPEAPQRLRGIRERLVADGHDLVDVGARDELWVDRVHRLHDERYVQRFRNAVDRGDELFDSSDTPLSPGTWIAATTAVQAGLDAVDAVFGGAAPRSFVAARPPGHHAERDLAMGFCYFNTLAIAAQYAQDAYGVERIAIYDFDVHHGNGTQHLFEERSDIFFASVHQYPFYPGTGAATERGKGIGEGTTVNIPLSAGSGDEAYAEAIEAKIYPAIEAFSPDVLFVSAGFDAWQNDPLGGQRITEQAFRTWGSQIRDIAERHSNGKIISVLEGGYDLDALPNLVAAYLDGIEGT
ncbi:MAG: histone deacetylase [Acidobacteriota bacterium]|nr:histone deacetylase [Acidobacteriota bacterium]